jgi:hypothetical protein
MPSWISQFSDKNQQNIKAGEGISGPSSGLISLKNTEAYTETVCCSTFGGLAKKAATLPNCAWR